MKFEGNNWKLPPPPPPEKYIWTPVVRLGSVIPWGYKQDPEDANVLLPIEEELEELERAKRLLREYSLPAVAEWLGQRTGRSITPDGLSGRIKLEKKRYRDAQNAEFYAELAKKAAEKAEKIKNKIGGTKPTRVCPDFEDV